MQSDDGKRQDFPFNIDIGKYLLIDTVNKYCDTVIPPIVMFKWSDQKWWHYIIIKFKDCIRRGIAVFIYLGHTYY